MLSMAMSRISLGKRHIALSHMWILLKYLLTVISITIPQ